MSVTINTIGANSRQIVIANEISATNIIAAVDTSLTALGWTLIDTVTSGSRGLLTTKVYSAPNADTITTKYMIIRYDLHRQYWFVSCCESWNTTTNVATNESWSGGRQILLPLQYSNCTLYVWANVRYAAFMGVVQAEPSAWQGIFEFERAAPEDIAANTVPCFGWTSSLTIGEPYGNVAANQTQGLTSNPNGFVACGFAPPRTANGLTGASAGGIFTIITNIGSYPPPKGQVGADWNSGGITQSMNSNCAMLGSWGDGQGYVWNSNDVLISNFKLSGYASDYVLGNVYGLKITSRVGSVLSTSTVPVDANLFYSASGTPTTHSLLGINGGYCDVAATPTGATNKLIASVYTSATTFGQPFQSVMISGRYVYFTTTTGFHKYDISSQSYSYNILPAAAYYSVKFDGGNNLYVTTATANTLYKVSLTDDTYTSLTMTGSWSSLAIDDTNLYVGSSGAATNVTLKRVTLSSFTEAASYSIASGSASNWITHLSTGDYAGYVYIGTLALTTASNNRVTRLDTNTGTQTTITPSISTSSNATGAQPIFFDGTSLYFYIINGSGSVTTQFRLMQVALSNFSLTREVNASSATTLALSPYVSTGIELLGSCEPPFFAGMMLISANNSAGSPTFRIVPVDPRTTPSPPAMTPTFDTNNVIWGQPCSDQCSFYTLSSTTKLIRYTNATRNYNFNGVQTSNLLIAQ